MDMSDFDFGAFRSLSDNARAPCENCKNYICKDAYPNIARHAYIKMCKASGYKRYIPIEERSNENAE